MHVSRRFLAATAIAVPSGLAIAWVDTRPHWDDTGITAGAVIVAAGLSTFLGLRWWASALIVACPLLLAEVPKAGWRLLIVLALAVLGSLLGRALRVRRA